MSLEKHLPAAIALLALATCASPPASDHATYTGFAQITTTAGPGTAGTTNVLVALDGTGGPPFPFGIDPCAGATCCFVEAIRDFGCDSDPNAGELSLAVDDGGPTTLPRDDSICGFGLTLPAPLTGGERVVLSASGGPDLAGFDASLRVPADTPLLSPGDSGEAVVPISQDLVVSWVGGASDGGTSLAIGMAGPWPAITCWPEGGTSVTIPAALLKQLSGALGDGGPTQLWLERYEATQPAIPHEDLTFSYLYQYAVPVQLR
jgi:hypothetical protein